VAHVLQPFVGDEAILAAEVRTRAVKALECWLEEGIDLAMSRYNGSVDEKPREKKSAPETPPGK
jgi:hypothetical protein